MDYSLLLGIHDVERAEREEEAADEDEDEETDSSGEEEEEDERSPALAPGPLSPSEGIAGYMNSFKQMGPGDFDPYVDVYAIQSAIGERWVTSRWAEAHRMTPAEGNDDWLPLSGAGAPQREVYFMGLIDVLTQYDTKKKAAHAAKAVKHGVGNQHSLQPKGDAPKCPNHGPDQDLCFVPLCPFNWVSRCIK